MTIMLKAALFKTTCGVRKPRDRNLCSLKHKLLTCQCFSENRTSNWLHLFVCSPDAQMLGAQVQYWLWRLAWPEPVCVWALCYVTVVSGKIWAGYTPVLQLCWSRRLEPERWAMAEPGGRGARHAPTCLLGDGANVIEVFQVSLGGQHQGTR